MKRLSLLFLLISFSFSGIAQKHNAITTVDSFFVGIPVKEGFIKWLEYISAHPFMGIDSANYRGSYSSLKNGIKSHFPFPENIQVKILTGREQPSKATIEKPTSQYELSIEGVFGNDKSARRAAKNCYDELKSILKKYYKTKDTDNYFSFIKYSKGINTDFPDIILYMDYSKELGFYFVMLTYTESAKN